MPALKLCNNQMDEHPKKLVEALATMMEEAELVVGASGADNHNKLVIRGSSLLQGRIPIVFLQDKSHLVLVC